MKTYTLTLDTQMLQIIGAAIGELPTKHGMPVTLEINRQIIEQDKSASAPAVNGHEIADQPTAH